MIDYGTALRIVHDIWRWKPVVEPKVRGSKDGTVFIWPWSAGRRAIQRLACLQVHTHLLADLRRRMYIEGDDDTLSHYLSQLSIQARRCVPEKVSEEIVGAVLKPDGTFGRVEVPKNYKAPKTRTEDDALEEAKAMDEEWGDESVVQPRGERE